MKGGIPTAGIKSKQTLADFAPRYRKQLERAIKAHPGMTIEEAKHAVYEQRVLSKMRKNPDVSLTEARGHKKPLPETATKTEKAEASLKEKASALRLQSKYNLVDPVKAKEAQKILRKMQRETKKAKEWEKLGLGEKMSSLEWTIWSQEQKQREVQAAALLGTMTEKKAARAKGILDKMQAETEKMWAKHPPGDPKYYAAQRRLAALYKRLEKLGLVHRLGDLTAGDVGYH